MGMRRLVIMLMRKHKLSLSRLLCVYPLLKVSDNGVFRILGRFLLTLVNQPLNKEILVHVFLNHLLCVRNMVYPLKVFERFCPFLLCKNHQYHLRLDFTTEYKRLMVS
jgi:hypothetical protein